MGSCLSLRFDGSGGRLAVMCEREVLLLDLATRLETAKVSNPHREDLTAFDLAASGTRLLTAGHEGEVAVWDAVTLAADPPLLGQWLAAPGPAPAARCPAPGGVVAPTGDRRGMRLFDVSRKTSRGCAAPERKRSDAQALEVASGCKTSIA